MRTRFRALMTTGVCLLVLLGLVLPAATAAKVERDRFVLDMAGIVTQGCAEDVLITSGQFAVHSVRVEDGAGGLHSEWHANFRGAQGTGIDTGDKYIYLRTSNSTSTVFNLGTLDGPVTIRNSNRVRTISANSGEDYVIVMNYRITIAATGEFTVQVDDFSATCS